MIGWTNVERDLPKPYQDVLVTYTHHGRGQFAAIAHWASHLGVWMTSCGRQLERDAVTYWASIELPVQAGA